MSLVITINLLAIAIVVGGVAAAMWIVYKSLGDPSLTDRTDGRAHGRQSPEHSPWPASSGATLGVRGSPC